MQYPMPKAGVVPTPAPGAIPAAQPTPQGQQGQAPQGGTSKSDNDPTKRFRAWYPRWWLLSAVLCGVLVAVILLAQWVGCKGSFAALPVCQFDNWSDWRQLPVVAIAWAVFLLGWFLLFILYVTPIEFKHPRSAWSQFLASLSHTRAVYSYLYIYGAVAFCAIMAMWLHQATRPLPFALCTMILFVTNAQFFHRIHAKTRRSYLLGYGILSFVSIIAMLISGKFQPVLFTSEIVLLLIGGWATFSLVRHPWDETEENLQLEESEELAVKNDQALETGAIASRLFDAILTTLRIKRE